MASPQLGSAQQEMVRAGSSSVGLAGWRTPERSYTIKRPWLSFLGLTFRVFGPGGNLVMFARRKLLTLKDQWTFYADEAQTIPLFHAKARKALGLNVITDFIAADTGEVFGSVKNGGLGTLLKDSWEVLDVREQPVGTFREDSNALLRRFFPILLGHWTMDLNGRRVAKLDQVFRFFIKEFTVTGPELGKDGDIRLVLACCMLAVVRENAREAG